MVGGLGQDLGGWVVLCLCVSVVSPKNDNRAPIAGGGRGRHNLHRVCQIAVTVPLRVCCVVWSRCYKVMAYLTSPPPVHVHTQNVEADLV